MEYNLNKYVFFNVYTPEKKNPCGCATLEWAVFPPHGAGRHVATVAQEGQTKQT